MPGRVYLDKMKEIVIDFPKNDAIRNNNAFFFTLV